MNGSEQRGRHPLASVTGLIGVVGLAAGAAAVAAEDNGTDHEHGGSWLHEPMTEVVVTASATDQTLAEITQGVTVLAGDELQRAVRNTIGETLALQPGVTASYFGPGSSRPIIRGLGGARVRVMEDGISTLDVSTVSVDHAVGIEPLLVDRVEVLRGPATLAYGSGAVGGVVNTTTSRLPRSLPEKRLEGRFELSGDSVADERTAAFGVNASTGKFVWHLDGVLRETEDYAIPGAAEVDEPDDGPEAGILENSDLKSDAFGGGVSWIGDRGFIGVSISSFDTNYGVPGEHAHAHGHEGEEEDHDGHEGEHEHGEDEEEEEEETIRIDLQQVRYDLRAGWTREGRVIDSILFRAAYNDYEHVELEGAEIGTQFENDAFEGRVEISHQPFGAWEGVFGLQFDQREFSAIGDEAFVPPVDSATLGAFMVEEGTFGRWQTTVGGRIETQAQDPSNGPRVEDNAYSVSGGLTRFVGDRDSFVLNLSLSQRLPSSEELFSDGPHLATQTFEIGDAALGVETSQHAEIGWRRYSERFTVNVAAFYTRFEDYIYLSPTGGMEDGLPVFQWTQADAEFTGLEAEATAKLARLGRGEVDFRVFGDVVSGELTDGGNLPRISPARIGARLEYHDDRLSGGVDTTFVLQQDQIAAFETATDGYTMLNADVSWTVDIGDSVNVDLFVRASNLLDEEARRHVSFVKDFAPLPGRNVSFGLRGRF